MTVASEHNSENESKLTWMEKHQRDLLQLLEQQKQREWRWGWARIFTFLAAASVWIPLRESPPVAGGAVLGALILFAFGVKRHRRARLERESGQRLVEMTRESLQRCGGTVKIIRSGCRPDDGEPHNLSGLPSGPTAPLTAQEWDDLDLYAQPAGIFGLINRTSTIWGARHLRDFLENPLVSTTYIIQRQESIKWLAQTSDKRVRLMAAAASLRDNDSKLDSLVKLIHTADNLPSPILRRVMRYWSIPSTILTCIGCIQAAYGNLNWLPFIFLLCGVNSVALLQIFKPLRSAVKPWQTLSPTVGGFHIAAQQAAENLPDTGELGQLRLQTSAVIDKDVLLSLRNRIAWSESGGIMHAMCNIVFFYDLHVATAILNCVLNHRDEILTAAGAIADLEALNSLACFAWEQPLTCWPQITDEPVLSIEQGIHPLIEPQKVVANCLNLEPKERTWIVSGSNMAGKSTFLRMIGVNTLLSLTGTTATAGTMIIQPRKLITDLRIRDDLSKHESYFLAEVRQVRRMICPEDKGIPIIGLIDELFRGTNSQDRVAAGIAVVSHLIDSTGFFVVATHEQSLSELADKGNATCYHFHEDLTNSGPIFDYHLKPGSATRRNALEILSREGYPENVIHIARTHINYETNNQPRIDKTE